MKTGDEATHKPEFGSNDFGFHRGPPEPFHVAYERKRMPDFGALEYAYMGLQLRPDAICGAGAGVRLQGVNITQPEQAYVVQGVPENTLWLSAGAMYNQPLTDDAGNFVEQATGFGIPPSVYRNVPATHWIDNEVATNNPFPDRRI